MTFTIVHTTTAAAFPVTIPSTTAGNTLIVCIGGACGTAPASIASVSLGATSDVFIQDLNANDYPTSHNANFIFRDAGCSGGQTSINVGTNNLGITAGITVYEINSTTGPLIPDGVTPSSGFATSGTTYTSGSIVTTTASEVWIGMTYGNNGIVAPTTLWTNASPYAGFDTGYRIVSATGTATYNGTMTSGNLAAASVIAYKAMPPVTSTGAVSMSSMHVSGIGGPFVNVTMTGAVKLASMAVSGVSVLGYPFPLSILGFKLEILINGTWVDITSFAYQRAVVAINRGRPDESESATPGSMTLTLNNRDGRFSPKNPNGAYYPFVGRNTQVRASAQSVTLSGGPMSYRFWGETSNWPPQWDATGNDMYVEVTIAGVLQRLQQGPTIGSALSRYWESLPSTAGLVAYWPMEDGSIATSFASGLSGGTPMTWTGTPSLSEDSSFGGSDDLPELEGSIWTGSAPGFSPPSSIIYNVPGTYQCPIPAGITTVGAAAWAAGGPGSSGFPVDIFSGDYQITRGGQGGGSGEFAYEPALSVVGMSSITVVVGAGGSPPDYSNFGFPGGDTTITGTSVVVHAHGGQAGYNSFSSDTVYPMPGGLGGTGSSNSTHHNGAQGGTGANTFYDLAVTTVDQGVGMPGGGASSAGPSSAGNPGGAASATAGQGGAPVSDGGPGGNGVDENNPGLMPTYGPGGGGAGGGGGQNSDAAPPTIGVSTGAAGYAGQAIITFPGGATAPANVMVFLLKIPSGGGIDGAVLAQMQTVGTVAYVDVVYHTGGNLELIGYNNINVSVFDSGPQSVGADGTPLIVMAQLVPSGSNINWTFEVIAPGTSGPIGTYTGSLGGTVGSLSGDVVVNVGGTDTGDTVIGHLAVLYSPVSMAAIAYAASGYDGELGAVRFGRLLTSFSIPYVIVGNNSDTPQMGPQTDDTLINLLQAIEDMDRGQIFEPRTSFGLGYRTRMSLYNQAVALQVDYAQSQLVPPLQPTLDDQLSRNDVTITRNGGSSARAVLTGPADGWSFTANGTPSTHSYFIATVAQANVLRIGDAFYDTLNPGVRFEISSIGAPSGGFQNVSFTPASTTIMGSTDVVTQYTAMNVQVPPVGIGDYAYSNTVAAFSDAQLPDLATWIMAVGTIDQYRYPVVTIDMTRSQMRSLFAQIASLDIGSFFQILNIPSNIDSTASQGGTRQLAWGFTETLNNFVWTIAINAVPEIVYEGGNLPTW